MSNGYRTPEERRKYADDRLRIAAVLREAHADGVSMLAAMDLGEDPDVVEAWINRLWNGLRDNLDGEDLLFALIVLMEPAMEIDAEQLISAPQPEACVADLQSRPRWRAALVGVAARVAGIFRHFASGTDRR